MKNVELLHRHNCNRIQLLEITDEYCNCRTFAKHKLYTPKAEHCFAKVCVPSKQESFQASGIANAIAEIIPSVNTPHARGVGPTCNGSPDVESVFIFGSVCVFQVRP